MNAHLARIGADSRPTGSAACDDARAYCAEVLAGLGFVVSKHSFEYSQFLGKWAAPVAGVAVPLLATAWWAFGGRYALLLLFVAAAVARRAAGRSVLDGRFLRARGANLRAVRGIEPRVWLVAHVDSKWQPVSMLARVGGVVLLVAGVVATLVTSTFGWPFSSIALALTWAGGLPLILSTVGARNDGSLDNASGVAAVLEAAAIVPRHCALGVMITDAEELALAGAAAWAREETPAIALNCDSIDDEGSLLVMHSGSSPQEIVSPLRAAASAHGESFRVMRGIPGVLADHVALNAAGWRSVTLSRGTVRTLQRIHTSRDTLMHMNGSGITAAARVLAQAARELAECK